MRRCAFVLSLVALVTGMLSAAPRTGDEVTVRFRVQLAPLCNVLTLSVVEGARGLTATGVDDRCGLGPSVPVSGRALRTADGSYEVALYLRDGRGVQLVSTRFEQDGGAGTWQDTAGRTGMAVRQGFTPTGPSRVRAGAVARDASLFGGRQVSGGGSGAFNPRSACTYGREVIGFQNSEFLCGDVITPLPFGATDMALGSDGNPVLVGPGVAGVGVLMTRCGNPACSAGNTVVPLSVAALPKKIVVGADGLPVVAMLAADMMTVVRCWDLNCASATASPVATTSATSFALAIGSDGLPLLVDGVGGAVRVIHCGDGGCGSGNTSVAVPLQDLAPQDPPQIALSASGLPVIAFRYDVPVPYPQVEDGVKVFLCADITCASGTTSGPLMSNTLSQQNKFCCGLSVATGSDGLPIVASHRMFWGLWTAHCEDFACNTSAAGAKNDDWTLPGIFPRLLIGAHGVPVIAHRGANDSTVRVTECSDAACTGYGLATRTITVGAFAGAAVLGSEGLPLLSYSAAGGPVVLACGTKGCQVPPPASPRGPSPMALPPRR